MKVLTVFLFVILISAAYSQDSPYYIKTPKFEKRHWMFSPQIDTTSVSGSWSFLQPLTFPLLGINSFYWPDSDKIFICGGIDTLGLLQTACYTYNLALNVYEPKAPLPDGRWSGKLVRVRDSLYLIGSIGTDFSLPDGKIYRYSLNTNQWIIKNPMPAPLLQESAACVFNDSIIITIGGSTDRFEGATRFIRLYNPWKDSWVNSPTNYPVRTTTAHAECYAADSLIVLGGYGNVINDVFYRVKILLRTGINLTDSLAIAWDTTQTPTPFGTGIYRVSGGRWGNNFIFGPGLGISSNITSLYIGKAGDTQIEWHRIIPDMIDSTSNIPQVAVKTGTDSSYFYFFGGYRNLQMTNQVKVLAISNLPPIGIDPVTHNIPRTFKLYQNYPNPFNPVSKIKFDVKKAALVNLSVYDILGRKVRTLVNLHLKPGTYEAEFDGTELSTGLYFCTMKINNFFMDGLESIKMVLIK